MRQWFAACLLLVFLAPAALAGGLHARIEGPAGDGVTYTVRALECPPGIALKPCVCADGLLDGKLRSLRWPLEPTTETGVYTFRRTWPHRGDWMLRVNLGDLPPPGPATVAAVARDGRVRENQFYWHTHGVPECRRVLEELARKRGIKLDDGC